MNYYKIFWVIEDIVHIVYQDIYLKKILLCILLFSLKTKICSYDLSIESAVAASHFYLSF